MKEMEKEDMLEDAEETRLSSTNKMKEHLISTKDKISGPHEDSI